VERFEVETFFGEGEGGNDDGVGGMVG